MAKSIDLIRGVSRSRAVAVMVGGPLLLRRPDLAARVCADVVARDAEGAARQAGRLPALCPPAG